MESKVWKKKNVLIDQYIDEIFNQKMADKSAGLSKDFIEKGGVFGPNSKMWKIFREKRLFFGITAAGLHQMAHPHVAKILVERSELGSKPDARIHRTVDVMLQFIFGDFSTAKKISHQMIQMHSVVLAKSGFSQKKLDEMFFWIYASTLSTMIKTYEKFVQQLNLSEKNQLYEESKIWAILFGVPIESLPSNFRDFNRLMRLYDQSHKFSLKTKKFISHLIYFNSKPEIGYPSWLIKYLNKNPRMYYLFRDRIVHDSVQLLTPAIRNQLSFLEKPNDHVPTALSIARVFGLSFGRRLYVQEFRDAVQRLKK